MTEIDEKPAIAIIGIGPIGGILGAYLAKNQEDVVLVDVLKEHVDAIKKHGLTLSGIVDMNVQVEKLCYSISELEPFAVDLIFIAVKAPVLKKVIGEIKAICRPQTKIVSYQNGLDNERLVADVFGEENTLRVVINYAGGFVRNGVLKMTFFNKPNHIGTLSESADKNARNIAGMMTNAGLDTEFTPNIRKYEWEKVILNSALSPVCAITKLTMKQAMEFEGTRKIVEETLREGIAVAEADGYNFDANFFESCVSYLRKAGDHLPSMYHDIKNRKPTEIGFLNEKIAEHGKKYGIGTLYNSMITDLVRAIEIETHIPLE